MKMNPTRFLALSLMALTIMPTAFDKVRGTKKNTIRPTGTGMTAGASATVMKSPTRVSLFGRLIRQVPTSSHLAHVMAHSCVCFFFLFAVKTPLRHTWLRQLPSCVLWALLGCAFLGNSPGIPQEFREWAFEI